MANDEWGREANPALKYRIRACGHETRLRGLRLTCLPGLLLMLAVRPRADELYSDGKLNNQAHERYHQGYPHPSIRDPGPEILIVRQLPNTIEGCE